MQISELKDQLTSSGLITAHVGMALKSYVSSERVIKNNKWSNLVDVFGIFKGQDGTYCFFITDSERGIPEYTAVFPTESEACDALMIKIARSERIYKKKATENSKENY